MLTIINWRQIPHRLGTRWLGPTGVVEFIKGADALEPLAGWITPAGFTPSNTLDGDKGEITILGGQWLVDDMDLGTFN